MKWKSNTASASTGSVHRLRGSHIRVSVHRHIDEDSQVWFVSCYELNVQRVRLQSHTLPSAKREALAMLGAYLTRYRQDLEEMEKVDV